ncbi:DNA sulfur modification protein DndB [Chamaesiphon sp. OTE_20_metabat_361]|uniref:DNA sulfur modification protein DndB n=1 Tax=Chamaesiphon sp. OTE_20_metabat_361 TaxID=2964689 RepID=UPI00286A0055|nr:DNA sulfur modification protein DndB [Chamaesiphon sp. OTE_20_metabat_361]
MDSKSPNTNVIFLETERDALDQATRSAATSGARLFICHVYEQGNRTHLAFSLSLKLLLEIAKLNSADGKKNKSNAEEMMNRPLMQPHVKEIAKYLVNTEAYILPPFIFNSDTPIKVFAFGSGSVKFGYAVISSDVLLYVTDGQHRLKAIENAVIERPELYNDSVTVLVVQEEDLEQIHQDFADCSKNKPIPPALRASFDVSDFLSKITRDLTKQLDIFKGRIDKISTTVGKDVNYIFTMSQLRVGVSEFLFGTSNKNLDSYTVEDLAVYKASLEKAKSFYLEFARNNTTWSLLFQPPSQSNNLLNFYNLRQERIDFNSVGFIIISRIGHLILSENNFTEEKNSILIKALANLDYRRTCSLWENSVVIDDDKGGKRIIAQRAAINKAIKVAISEIERQTGISLN